MNLTSIPKFRQLVKKRHYYKFAVAFCTLLATFASIIYGLSVGVVVAIIIAITRFWKEELRIEKVEKDDKSSNKISPEAEDPLTDPHSNISDEFDVFRISLPSFLNQWSIPRIEASLSEKGLIQAPKSGSESAQVQDASITLDIPSSSNTQNSRRQCYVLDFQETLYIGSKGLDMVDHILDTSTCPIYIMNLEKELQLKLKELIQKRKLQSHVGPSAHSDPQDVTRVESVTKDSIFFDNIDQVIRHVIDNKDSE